jgi:hypothetical protein
MSGRAVSAEWGETAMVWIAISITIRKTARSWQVVVRLGLMQ